jgi:hypothetical protein
MQACKRYTFCGSKTVKTLHPAEPLMDPNTGPPCWQLCSIQNNDTNSLTSNAQGIPDELSFPNYSVYPAGFSQSAYSVQPQMQMMPAPFPITGAGTVYSADGLYAPSPSESSHARNGSPFTLDQGLDLEETEEMLDEAESCSDNDDEKLDIKQFLLNANKACANPLPTLNTSHPAVATNMTHPVPTFSPSLNGTRIPFTPEECKELKTLTSVQVEERILHQYGPPNFPGQTYNYGDSTCTLPDSRSHLLQSSKEG